jgi:hypothetical protein
MSDSVKVAFQTTVLTLPLQRILPTRTFRSGQEKTVKYRRIAASVLEVGIIEPLVVFPQIGGDEGEKTYILLDGNLRYQVLKALGETETKCLIATDDESYTYNRQVNRLSTIQETFMLLKALEGGVSEERLAKALDVDVKKLREKRDLLKGICPEAVTLLKDRFISPKALRFFKRVTPMRQIEMAELMTAASNFTEPYARALYLATSRNMLLEPDKPKEVDGVTPEAIARMEKEMESLEHEFKLVEDTHGMNVLQLVLARGYLAKLSDNARIVRFLSQGHPEILSEFQKIVEATSLEA